MTLSDSILTDHLYRENPRIPHKPETRITMANQFLSLSLFLMLLSFFIVLNSMSTFEKQTAVPAVLNSLNLAFSGRDQNLLEGYMNVGPSAVLTPYENGKGEGDTLETIEGLFNAHLAGFRAKRNRLGTVMHVSLPMSEFERAVKTASLEAPQGGDANPMTFSQTMITLLRSAELDRPYRIDMVYNLENDPMVLLRGAPDSFKSALIRVSALAGTLERKGMPRKMMSAGLAKGRPGYIDLYFYRYKPLAVSDNIREMQEEEARAEADAAAAEDSGLQEENEETAVPQSPAQEGQEQTTPPEQIEPQAGPAPRPSLVIPR